MEVGIITELINTVGFPIAVSVALFYQNFKTNENHNKTYMEFKDVINQNSRSIDKLTEIVSELKKERD